MEAYFLLSKLDMQNYSIHKNLFSYFLLLKQASHILLL